MDAVNARWRGFAPVALLSLLAFAGCTDTPPSNRAATSPTPTASAPTLNPTPTAPPHPVSLQALMQTSFNGRDLRVGRVLARESSYTRYFVTYRSGDLRISGIMNVPAGDGPFPVLILNHGYIDPDIYVNGQGLRREQDYLARRGFVVLHTDYRGHASSDDDPNADLRLRLGYAEDVINAILAVKGSSLPYLDGDRVGLLGRSMGGGVTYNAAVARPDLIDAIVVFAPVSSNAVDNFERWIDGPAERRELARRIIAAYGSPQDNPTFWANISAINFFDRIAVPVIIHHGTADESVPYDWSERTVTALEAAGKDVTFYTYPGEHHAFGPQWPESMVRTVSFFRRYLRA